MILVGYDENQQAFEVMSVWCKVWGNNGYLWMSYDDFGKLAQDAYVMIPNEDY